MSKRSSYIFIDSEWSFFLKKKADPLKQNRSQDAIIALLWRWFIETNGSDPRLLPRLPMTKVEHTTFLFIGIQCGILKAAVRGMDTIQQFLRQQAIPVPEKFVVSGVSKVSLFAIESYFKFSLVIF